MKIKDIFHKIKSRVSRTQLGLFVFAILFAGIAFFLISENRDGECSPEYKIQRKYLNKDMSSLEFNFDKYKTKNSRPETLKSLDLNYSKTAKEFRTSIIYQLKDEIDFDGKYTVVGTGMTGWDGPVWIVDRSNGKAYEFPYHHYRFSLDYSKDSNLIVVNSKERIKEMHEIHGCSYLNIMEDIVRGAYDLRPHYFVWEDGEFKYLGPQSYTPNKNPFWGDYFNNN
ncbi:MAG: hypothetical protein WC089_00480 [Candidatus Paceibacterota bacterium]